MTRLDLTQIKQYKRLLIGLFIVLAVLITINLLIKPHVTAVTWTRDYTFQDKVAQQMILHFNLPMNTDLTKLAITVLPETTFTAQWQGQKLLINFTESLIGSSNYMLNINAAEDIYANKVAAWQYTWQTKPNELIYLSQPTAGVAEIKLLNINTEQEQIIYSTGNYIRDYRAFNNNVAVQEDIGNDTTLITICQLSVKKCDQKIKISNILNSFDIHDSFLIIAHQPQPKQNEYHPVIVDRYDLATMHKTQLDFGEANDILNFDSLAIAPDGKTMLARDGALYTYQVIDLAQPSKNINLGRFITTGGYTWNGQRLIMTSVRQGEAYTYPYQVVIDSNLKAEVITDPSYHNIDGVISPDGSLIMYASKYKDYEFTKGLYQIILGTLTKENLKLTDKVVDADGQVSYELPTISYDNQYLAFEVYSKDQLKDFDNYRDVKFQGRPSVAEIAVYDVNNKKITMQFPGTMPKWR